MIAIVGVVVRALVGALVCESARACGVFAARQVIAAVARISRALPPGQRAEVAVALRGPRGTIAQQVFYEGDPEPDYHPRRAAMDRDGDIWHRSALDTAWRCCGSHELATDWATLAARYGPLVTFAVELPDYYELVDRAEQAGTFTP